MNLNECVKHYQNTGVFLPEAHEFQFEFIMENIQEIYNEYISEFTSESGSFMSHFLLRIHNWQVDVGFGMDVMDDNLDEILEILDEIHEND